MRNLREGVQPFPVRKNPFT